MSLATVASAQIQFTDVSDAAGLSPNASSSSNGHGLGVLWFDFDQDGWDDLFVVDGKGQESELYHNLGGSFELRSDLLPVLPDVERMSAIAGDVDGDGDEDVYVFCDHEQLDGPLDGPPNLLLLNQFVENGGVLAAPLFVEAAQLAGVDDLASPPLGPTYDGYRSPCGTFLDHDRDGHLDLYVGHWSTQQGPGFEGNLDRLFRNLGDGTFEDVSASVGLPQPGDDPLLFQPTLAMLAAPIDGDRFAELVLAHRDLDPALAQDRVLGNDGAGTYLDLTDLSPGFGVDSFHAHGVVCADLNGDGVLDLYVSNAKDAGQTQANRLYLGNGDGTFSADQATLFGVEADDSFAAVAFDVDQDGDQDLFVGTTATAVPDQNFLYVADGGTFHDESVAAGLGAPGDTRGAAVADFDHDGDLDLAVAEQGDRLRLYRNDTVSANHWLGVRLRGVWSNRSALGAVVEVEAAGLHSSRTRLAATGAKSQDSATLHFGLGTASSVDRLIVHWPSGIDQELRGVSADQVLTIDEELTLPVLRARIGAESGHAGDHTQLVDSDDHWLTIRSKSVGSTERASVVLKAVSPFPVHDSVVVHVEARARTESGADARIDQSISYFDWQRGDYAKVDLGDAPTKDTGYDVVLPTARAQNPDDGRILVEVRWITTTQEVFQGRLDQVYWTLR